jgi:hypothetical protein
VDENILYGANRRIKIGAFENKVLWRIFVQRVKEEVMEDWRTLQDE